MAKERGGMKREKGGREQKKDWEREGKEVTNPPLQIVDPPLCPSGSVGLNILIFIENEKCYCSVAEYFCLQTAVTKKYFKPRGLARKRLSSGHAPKSID